MERVYGLGRNDDKGVCFDVQARSGVVARRSLARMFGASWLDEESTYCCESSVTDLAADESLKIYRSRHELPKLA